jgi:hypothetical protein
MLSINDISYLSDKFNVAEVYISVSYTYDTSCHMYECHYRQVWIGNWIYWIH